MAKSPILILRILSPSTRNYDLTTKRKEYFLIPSLRHYLLIDSETVSASLFSRKEPQVWPKEPLHFSSPTDSIPLSASTSSSNSKTSTAKPASSQPANNPLFNMLLTAIATRHRRCRRVTIEFRLSSGQLTDTSLNVSSVRFRFLDVTQATDSTFEDTNRLRSRNAAGLSTSRTARMCLPGLANQGSRRMRSGSRVHVGAG